MGVTRNGKKKTYDNEIIKMLIKVSINDSAETEGKGVKLVMSGRRKRNEERY